MKPHSSRSVLPRLSDCTRGRLAQCLDGVKVGEGRGGRTLRLQHVVVIQQRTRGCALRQIQLYTKNRNEQSVRNDRNNSDEKTAGGSGGGIVGGVVACRQDFHIPSRTTFLFKH